MPELPAPPEVRNSDDVILSITLILDTLGRGKMLHNAERFEEENGTAHVPTYGLRVAADGFCRAADIIADGIRPLSQPRKHMLIACIKNAAIGLHAWSQALEHDWNMIKPRCGLHCKTCTSRGSAEYFKALENIIKDAANSLRIGKARVTAACRACSKAAGKLVDYADEVGKTDSFSQSWTHWRVVADQVDALAEPLADILSAIPKKSK